MSKKFAMKLVIDDVTSPLLHARLSATASPRERAALLRTIAEAACRGDTTDRATSQGHVAPMGPSADYPAARTSVNDEPRRPMSQAQDSPMTRVDTSQTDGLDTAAIAEGLAAYL